MSVVVSSFKNDENARPPTLLKTLTTRDISLSYAGLCKERSPIQVTDNFQRRALLRIVVETLKKSIFIFTIVNLVNKDILYFLTTTGA